MVKSIVFTIKNYLIIKSTDFLPISLSHSADSLWGVGTRLYKRLYVFFCQQVVCLFQRVTLFPVSYTHLDVYKRQSL